MQDRIVQAVVALLVLAASGAWAQNNQIPPSNTKIAPELAQALQVQGQADFILHFARQADLSPAYDMDWNARGRFVYDALRRNADESQAQARRTLDEAGIEYVSFFTGNLLYVRGGGIELASTLAGLPEVSAVTTAGTYAIVPPIIDDSVSAQPRTSGTLAWGIVDTGADQFWPTYGEGDGIVVANIDTGVQWNHPALAGAYKCGSDPADPACWSDPSNVCGAGGACDNNGHGTHVMGTMVGDNNPALTWQAGMAPGAAWIACKGCESNSCSDFALNSCADWIIAPNGNPANRPHVVNNSWGGGSGNNWYLSKVNAWRAAGIFPAFSAGNQGPTCGTLLSPGDYQESFATAAHDSGGTIASFSSRGPSAFGATPYTKPNISAPGVNVCSSVPTNGWSCGYSGTSMASPHTAGAVALLWACSPDLRGDIDATIQALQGTAGTAPAGDCGAPPSGQGNYTYGYGYLDVLAAGAQYCQTECLTDGDCPDDSLYCTGAPTCTNNECGFAAGPCVGAQPICDEGGDRCVECLNKSHCDPGYICTGNACVPRGTMQASSVKLKAGKTANTDVMKLTGSLDATGADLAGAIGGTLTVTIEAAYIPAPGSITFTFQVPSASVNKGKYTSPKVALVNKTDPVTSFSLDTASGAMKFSAKNVDLTGLACPITFRVQFGDYAAETRLSEVIVNGTRPCPLPLVMGVMDSLEALKVSGKKGTTPGADSVSISGTFTIDGSINPASPVVITLGSDTFTVPGGQFLENSGTYGCKSVDSGNAYISAKFDTVKCTYSIQIKGADVSGSGNVSFGINVFGNPLQVSGGVTLPLGF